MRPLLPLALPLLLCAAAGPALGDAAVDASADAPPDAPARPARLLRGPYLQIGRHDGVVVRWRTDLPTDSVVRYGFFPGFLRNSAVIGGARTEHEIALTGLTPAARYFYSVGSAEGVLAGDDLVTTFITAPPPGAAVPTRVWVLGDAGFANEALAGVTRSYHALSPPRHTDVWLLLGDNAYNSGLDEEYQVHLFDFHAPTLRRTFLWPTIGNHDTAQLADPAADIPYFASFTLPTRAEAGGRASGTERYYSFDHANIHFVCLDSMTSARTADGPMAVWLEADLAETRRDWIVAYWHHPPYSKGSHDSDVSPNETEMRQVFLPILERHGADLVMSGHSHAYERSYLLGGHYGTSDTFTADMKKSAAAGNLAAGPYRKGPAARAQRDGTVYVVAGSGSWLGGGTLNHPAMFVSLNVHGSLVLDVDGQRLDARFVRETGAVDDTFAIVKGPPPPVDAGADSAPDVGRDAGPDTATDGPDAASDAAPDTRDALADLPPDAPDAAVDARTDAAPGGKAGGGGCDCDVGGRGRPLPAAALLAAAAWAVLRRRGHS